MRAFPWERRVGEESDRSGKTVAAMGDGAACAEGGGDECGLGELGLGAPCGLGAPGVDLDAVGALRCEGDGDGHELLGPGWYCPVRHGGLVEFEESFPCSGSQFAELAKLLEIGGVVHEGILDMRMRVIWLCHWSVGV